MRLPYPLPQIAQTHDIPVRALCRWVARYRDSGLTGLERLPRNSIKIKAPWWQPMAEALALEKPKRSVAGIHRLLNQYAEQQEQAAPAYSTSKYFNNRIESDHARFKQKLKPMRGFKTFDTNSIN